MIMETLRHSPAFRPAHGLFFAIMVPAEARPVISACLDSFRSRYPLRAKPMAPERLHISLKAMHIGDHLPDKIVEMASRMGDAIRFEQFQIRLDRALSYKNRKPKKPFVLASSNGTRCINELGEHIALAQVMLSGARRNTYRPISPHVTLVWDTFMVPEHPITPISITVQQVTLVHSHIGQSRYEFLGDWPLVG